jgi:hypothetical protein
MRFALMIAAAIAVGAVIGKGIMLAQTGQAFDAVAALSADLKDYRLGDINPITRIYRQVMTKVSSGRPGVTWPSGPAWAHITPPNLNMGFKFDGQELRRSNAQNIVNQTRLFNQRMEDQRNFARNPAGWRGAPPF